MLLKDIKTFIKNEGSVTMTDLKLKFYIDEEDLLLPLDILLSKGYIFAERPVPDSGSSANCKGCSMGCKPDGQENTSPAPSFIIYKWGLN